MKYRIDALPAHVRGLRVKNGAPLSVAGDELELDDDQYAHFVRMGATLSTTDKRRKAPPVDDPEEVPPIDSEPLEPVTVPAPPADGDSAT